LQVAGPRAAQRIVSYLAITTVGVIDRKTTDELSVLVTGEFELALEFE
jgi:hypothetical protein